MPSVRTPDSALDLIADAIASLPVRSRNEILAFLDFWRDLPREDRAVFAKSVRPKLSDDAVARLCGVTGRTLYRWTRYQAFKSRLEDRGLAERSRPARPHPPAA